MSTTTQQPIGNATALIHRISAGWTAEQCMDAAAELSPHKAYAWSQVVEGAEVAFGAMGKKDLQEIAGQVWERLNEVAIGKAVDVVV